MEWNFKKTIEEMNDEELRQRIQSAMDWKNPNQIRKIPYLGGVEQVTEYMFGELQAFCPMTGISDLYKVTLRFIPDRFVSELKSLKLYFWAYRIEGIPISHEHLAAKIFKEFQEVIAPKKLYLKLDTAGRGELFTTIRIGALELDKYEDRKVSNL